MNFGYHSFNKILITKKKTSKTKSRRQSSSGFRILKIKQKLLICNYLYEAKQERKKNVRKTHINKEQKKEEEKGNEIDCFTGVPWTPLPANVLSRFVQPECKENGK